MIVLKYALIAAFYAVLLGWLIPFLVSAKSTLATLAGITLLVIFVILIPLILLLNKLNNEES